MSIFGTVATEIRGGVTYVTDIKLLSLDWVPLDRAGMKTRLVAVGEQGLKLKEESKVTLAELLGELRKLGAKPAQVVGEMGWDVKTLAKEMGWELDKIAGEVNAERWNQLLEAVKAVGEMAGEFGLTKEAKLSELVTMVKAAREAQLKAATAEHDKLIDKVIGEMVQAEAVRPLIKRMLQIGAAADEVAIKKAVGEMLAQGDVKKVLAEFFKGDTIAPKASSQVTAAGSNVIKRVSI